MAQNIAKATDTASVLQRQLDRLHESIVRGRSREESLSILEDVRGTATSLSTSVSLSASSSYQISPHRASLLCMSRPLTPAGNGLPPIPANYSPSTSLFRADGDTARYQSSSAALYDPLLGLESALRRHYGAGQSPGAPSGVSTVLADIVTSPLRQPLASASLTATHGAESKKPEPRTNERPSKTKRRIMSGADRGHSHQGAPAGAKSRHLEDGGSTIVDRRDLETPFPFHTLCVQQNAPSSGGTRVGGPHGTLLERLFVLLRFGHGTTTAYLLDTMNGDTQAAVLAESLEPGVRCGPFAEKLVKELTTYIMVKDTVMPRERTWEGEAFNRKVEERARRFPLLVSSGGGRLPDIDPRLDFAVDRPTVGIIETLRGLLPGSVMCTSSCGKAEKEQFVPPARGRACCVFATDDWVEISIEPWACCVTSYALASVCPITGGSPPRNWVLEAAYGKGKWATLREHVNDEGISKLKNYSIWDIPANLRSIVANKFRVRRTGPDARNGDTHQIAHFEVYGRFMACWPNGIANTEAQSKDFSATPAENVPPTRFVPPQPVPLPPEPVGKVAKKKKK